MRDKGLLAFVFLEQCDVTHSMQLRRNQTYWTRQKRCDEGESDAQGSDKGRERERERGWETSGALAAREWQRKGEVEKKLGTDHTGAAASNSDSAYATQDAQMRGDGSRGKLCIERITRRNAQGEGVGGKTYKASLSESCEIHNSSHRHAEITVKLEHVTVDSDAHDHHPRVFEQRSQLGWEPLHAA
jgi:hypothetical protein